MSISDHVESLKNKHAKLESKIESENSRPHPDDGLIADLKRRKLKLKDKISSSADAAVS